jgi:membrane protease YdiL (CAAX protease family)
MTTTAVPTSRVIPATTVRRMLVVFAGLYLANSFTPWSRGLWEYHRRADYGPFWISVVVLHLLTTTAVLITMRRHGWHAADLGLRVPLRRVAAGIIALVCVGLVVTQVARLSPLDGLAHHAGGWLGGTWGMVPATGMQRLGWPFVAVTCGVCEELVYRGFALAALRRLGLSERRAVVLATVAFCFVHGLAGVIFFPFYFLFGLAMATIRIRTDSLARSIGVHSLTDILVALL